MNKLTYAPLQTNFRGVGVFSASWTFFQSHLGSRSLEVHASLVKFFFPGVSERHSCFEEKSLSRQKVHF